MIGILGGIGSGKSSVIRAVRAWNFRLVDADRIGHELLHDPSVISQLRTAFGEAIFSGSQIDRKALGNRVFGSSDECERNLQVLNSILHPEIRKEILKQIQEPNDNVDAIILDAALLLEGGWAKHCDYLIYIDTPEDIRLQRVTTIRGWAPEELSRREARQLPLREKRAKADFVVDNSGSLTVAAANMHAVLSSILNT